MNNRISRINKFFSVLIILIAVSQGAVQSPIACFDSDGQVSLESECSPGVPATPVTPADNMIGKCHDCIDLPFWSYTSEFKPADKNNSQYFMFYHTIIDSSAGKKAKQIFMNLSGSAFSDLHLQSIQSTVLLL